MVTPIRITTAGICDCSIKPASCWGSPAKRRNLLKGKLINVVTDFRVHSFWYAPGADYYLVAGELAQTDLIKKGVPKDKIKVTGIPIDAKFAQALDKEAIRKELGLENIFTILISGGGFGVGPYQELIKGFSDSNSNIQLLVVCGKNDKLHNDLSQISIKDTLKLKLYHFVDNMDELMAASDCIISKSGGLTSSESMARNLPIIILRPIPGQESGNADYLEASGAGIIAHNPEEAVKAALSLANSTDELARKKENIQRIARPESTKEIVAWTLKL